MSLFDFIESKPFQKRSYNNGKVFGFIYSNCYFSKEACKILRQHNIPSELYDVKNNQFINNTDPLSLSGRRDDTYLEAYNHMRDYKKCGNWAYPHLFFYNDGWRYIGGKTDLEKSYKMKV